MPINVMQDLGAVRQHDDVSSGGELKLMIRKKQEKALVTLTVPMTRSH
jgi:hypothetical protein